MGGLLRFLLRYRSFLLFVALEITCVWLIIQNNTYQSAAFFHTSNAYAARMLAFSNSFNQYLNLGQENQRLATENAQLRHKLRQKPDNSSVSGDYKLDTLRAKKYQFITAKVINNSIRNIRNHLTLDKGTADGIKPGMGVITNKGVVGKVKTCSEHFSTVTSLLHVDMLVSVAMKKNNTVGSVKWEGNNPRQISLQEVPRDVQVKVGDTVVTSQYNSVFPEGILIGTVASARLKPGETFHEITLSLASDFYSLTYVYVVDNQLKTEQDSLEKY
ncbi:MAG: rod shape-determining protein MreC [Verrucomicrobia bacterium]|nr:rod shape-determining protein MreC [Cytophagales bacterium]